MDDRLAIILNVIRLKTNKMGITVKFVSGFIWKSPNMALLKIQTHCMAQKYCWIEWSFRSNCD